jgi:hypothetical protein
MRVAMVCDIRYRRFARYAICAIYGVVPAGMAARQGLTPSRDVQSDEVDRRDADAAVTIPKLDGSNTAVDSPPACLRSTVDSGELIPGRRPVTTLSFQRRLQAGYSQATHAREDVPCRILIGGA